MKAAIYHGNKDIRWEDVPEPETRTGHVKVKVAHNGICGTDIHEYFDGPILTPVWPHLMTGITLPVFFGHECSGIVVEVGQGVTTLKEGDRVAVEPSLNCGDCFPCRRGDYNLCDTSAFLGLSSADGGGLGEYLLAAEDRVHRLPDHVSLEAGAVVEPLSVAMHAVRRAAPRPDERVAVHGAGPVGLGVTLALAAAGVERIIVSEISEVRRKIVESLALPAVEAIIDPTQADIVSSIGDLVDDTGADLSFDVAGGPVANGPDGTLLVPFNNAIASTRRGGRMISVATHPTTTIEPNHFTFNELTIIGSAAYTNVDFRRVIELMDQGWYDVSAFVEHRGPDELVSAMEDMRDGKACKVLIDIAP